MAELSLQHVDKIYDNNVQAVFDFNLDVKDKEFIVFVGPSGCGKSTTLRMIAGLEEISAGDFYIDGKRMNDVEPKDRDIAMVFQSYALYPHMSVYENMAFGLKLRKFSKEEIDKRVHEAARILEIEPYLDRKPKALSGGQRQRVALGRAIVRNAKVFLMDEPLSNLDAKLRVQMRSEIIQLHERIGATTIYVTHDQTEAMTMADRIVVMKGGYIQQIGTPKEIYNNPELANVKKFIDSYEQITNIYYSWMDATLDKDERVNCCSMIEHCLDSESLVANKNVYMFDWGRKSVTIRRGPHADTSKPLELKSDMKLMRMMAKIVDWFELDKEAFEQFRILHSRVLNDRMINANITLSIHPLDYLTMSDNACDWESCMNWYQGGDYRLGTVEMMNSPVILEAYVESEHPYCPIDRDNRTWSNKRWRCLYIVNKDIITEIKQYPYNNIYLRDYVLNKIKQLAEQNMGWHYDDKMYEYKDSYVIEYFNIIKKVFISA